MQPRKLRTMDDMPLDGKRVLVRVDFNVTVGDDGQVDEFEDYRIEAALPTIQELMQRRCKVLLLTHRGRPTDSPETLALDPIKDRLEELLREDVHLLADLHGDRVESAVAGAEAGSVLLLDNIRKDEREMLANERFGALLAAYADMYINEAFSVSHRAHTSLSVLPRLLPSVAGRRTVVEVEALSELADTPPRPYVAIVSGAKISTKVGMLRRLLQKVDRLCVGGKIANVLLAAAGKGNPERFHANDLAAAQALLRDSGDKLVLPIDVVTGPENGAAAYVKIIGVEDIPADTEPFWDIGPKSAAQILDICQKAKTIMWNGPLGRAEVPAYAEATNTLAMGIAKCEGYRVVGGGDTVNVLERNRVISKYNHVSIGGGAMVAFLEGKRMPGLEPLYE